MFFSERAGDAVGDFRESDNARLSVWIMISSFVDIFSSFPCGFRGSGEEKSIPPEQLNSQGRTRRNLFF